MVQALRLPYMNIQLEIAVGLSPLRCGPCHGTGQRQAQECSRCDGCGCLWVRPAQGRELPGILGYIWSVSEVLSRARAKGLL
jgi:hypothetical protein